MPFLLDKPGLEKNVVDNAWYVSYHNLEGNNIITFNIDNAWYVVKFWSVLLLNKSFTIPGILSLSAAL